MQKTKNAFFQNFCVLLKSVISGCLLKSVISGCLLKSNDHAFVTVFNFKNKFSVFRRNLNARYFRIIIISR